MPEALPDLSYDQRKTDFFVKLALQHKDLMQLHIDAGQVSRSEAFGKELNPATGKDRNKRWGDVTQHCLVEAAVADVFSDMLDFDESQKQALVTAAFVHDAGKRSEIEAGNRAKAAGLSTEEIDQVNDRAYAASKQMLLVAGIAPEVVGLTEAVAHTSIGQFAYLDTENNMHLKDDIDVLAMAMHYIDDITWKSSVVRFDERIDGLESVAAARYPYNEEGRAKWGDRTYFEAQRESGHLIETHLAALAGVEDPVTLPDVINSRLHDAIMGATSEV